jgi:hypothetical protein
MNLYRYDIINEFIEKHKFQNYLEIGVFDGECVNKIKCENKDGVDPGSEKGLGVGVNFNVTSDEFFESHCTKKYDLIFIDGLHHSDQVDKDLENALTHTVDNGVIVLHDCNPPTLEHTLIPRVQPQWNGDVYKSILKFRESNTDHKIFTVDTDWGVGVIIKNQNNLTEPSKLDFKRAISEWEYFDTNRKELLNLITIQEFTDGKY